jgi:hypothetical protein
MFKKALLTSMTAIGLLSTAPAHALTVGWNFVQPVECIAQFAQYSQYGVDTLLVYPHAGAAPLTVTDPLAVATGSILCANGNGFYVYFNGGAVTAVALIPNLR